MAPPSSSPSGIRTLPLTSEPRRGSTANLDSIPGQAGTLNPSPPKLSFVPIPLTHQPKDVGRSSRVSSIDSTAVSEPSSSLSRKSSMSSALSATPAASPEELFSATLISKDVSSKFPEGYTARPLSKNDYKAGFLDVLRVLTTVGDITEERWLERFNYMKKREGDYYIIVVEDSNKNIVGTGAVVVERKFVHDLGLVGHIEDISVAKDQQGKKLGLRIIETLDKIAQTVGCYKSILDCSEANEGFYLKCGFKRAGLEMAHYY